MQPHNGEPSGPTLRGYLNPIAYESRCFEILLQHLHEQVPDVLRQCAHRPDPIRMLQTPSTSADVQLVQFLIEQCMSVFAPKKHVIAALSLKGKIDPEFVDLVWLQMEQQNPTFFKAYYYKSKLRDTILMYNHLYKTQLFLAQERSTLDLAKSIQPSKFALKLNCTEVLQTQQQLMHMSDLLVDCPRIIQPSQSLSRDHSPVRSEPGIGLRSNYGTYSQQMMASAHSPVHGFRSYRPFPDSAYPPRSPVSVDDPYGLNFPYRTAGHMGSYPPVGLQDIHSPASSLNSSSAGVSSDSDPLGRSPTGTATSTQHLIGQVSQSLNIVHQGSMSGPRSGDVSPASGRSLTPDSQTTPILHPIRQPIRLLPETEPSPTTRPTPALLSHSPIKLVHPPDFPPEADGQSIDFLQSSNLARRSPITQSSVYEAPDVASLPSTLQVPQISSASVFQGPLPTDMSFEKSVSSATTAASTFLPFPQPNPISLTDLTQPRLSGPASLSDGVGGSHNLSNPSSNSFQYPQNHVPQQPHAKLKISPAWEHSDRHSSEDQLHEHERFLSQQPVSNMTVDGNLHSRFRTPASFSSVHAPHQQQQQILDQASAIERSTSHIAWNGTASQSSVVGLQSGPVDNAALPYPQSRPVSLYHRLQEYSHPPSERPPLPNSISGQLPDDVANSRVMHSSKQCEDLGPFYSRAHENTPMEGLTLSQYFPSTQRNEPPNMFPGKGLQIKEKQFNFQQTQLSAHDGGQYVEHSLKQAPVSFAFEDQQAGAAPHKYTNDAKSTQVQIYLDRPGHSSSIYDSHESGMNTAKLPMERYSAGLENSIVQNTREGHHTTNQAFQPGMDAPPSSYEERISKGNYATQRPRSENHGGNSSFGIQTNVGSDGSSSLLISPGVVSSPNFTPSVTSSKTIQPSPPQETLSLRQNFTSGLRKDVETVSQSGFVEKDDVAGYFDLTYQDDFSHPSVEKQIGPQNEMEDLEATYFYNQDELIDSSHGSASGGAGPQIQSNPPSADSAGMNGQFSSQSGEDMPGAEFSSDLDFERNYEDFAELPQDDGLG